MKIRYDFVTNSSSSSYVICSIENEVLARLYRESGFCKTYGDELSERFDEDLNTSLNGPRGGSIAEWLIRVIDDHQIHYSYNREKYVTLRKSIEENKDAIDSSTKHAEFFTVHINSDGEGSSFSSEERRNGKIITTSLDNDEWDYKKEGEAIWEFLAGDVRQIRSRVKKMNGTWESDDPWYQEEDISDIFSSAEGFSFEGQTVCLTGDFDFGKKADVTAFIEKHGGSCVSSVTRKTTALLVGNKGSDAWSHGNYGSKVERALGLQCEGCPIRIFRETDVLSVPPDTHIKKKGMSESKPKDAPLLNRRKIEALADQFDNYRFSELDKVNIQEMWIRLFGKHIEKEPSIIIPGSIFVFDYDVDESVLMDVRRKGGICRARGTKVSKTTNYVVVTGTPEGSSALSFIRDALLLQSDGFPVKAVFAADLMKALESAESVSEIHFDQPLPLGKEIRTYNKVTPVSKEARQGMLLKLISEQEIGSQEELVKKLEESGFSVNQATVSRDMKDLDITKVRAANGALKYGVRTAVPVTLSKTDIDIKPDSACYPKNDRQKTVLKLISEADIGSQEELVRKLEESGFAVTQATVSRDMRDLGIIKTRDVNGTQRFEIQSKKPSEEPPAVTLSSSASAGEPRNDRQRILIKLVSEEAIGSQADLIRRMEESGFAVTQATVSRDMKELGIVKVPTGNGYRYTMFHNRDS